MEAISVFDIFKIGVGPSSSHTMGPWRAAQRFVASLRGAGAFERVARVRVDLFGSLAKTGKGHGTDVAVILGLSSEDPVTCATDGLVERAEAVGESGHLRLGAQRTIRFEPATDLLFHMDESLPGHPNAMRASAWDASGAVLSQRTYYSVGGGFVVEEGETLSAERAVRLPFPIERAEELRAYCVRESFTIPELVLRNELTWRSENEVRAGLLRIWRVMQECIYRGCNTEGILPGGLGVVRRAAGMSRRLMDTDEHLPLEAWLARVRGSTREFQETLRWVSAFALAVNEENAAFGRVVTAPTNGAAGVIPAVMMYAWCFVPRVRDDELVRFMLVAGEVGSLFKKGATISAAMGGCQAEIGVSSAMAAAGLTHVMGGDTDRCLMAAEIAMEHHLGMTCDPIAGLVQVPCIERNTMGAIKAITAANIAIEGDPAHAKVSLDDVIRTMWQTARDMSSKYKETAEGGLAVNVSVSVSEC